jgi:hypothetical protein
LTFDRWLTLGGLIQDHGLNPAQRFIVMKEPGSRDYIVLDGNRRLVAMKAVESPEALLLGATERFLMETYGMKLRLLCSS